VIIERFCKEIKFYDFDVQLTRREKIPMKKEGYITSIAYDDKNKIFGITCTDGYIHFY